jgi:hypothetical protein
LLDKQIARVKDVQVEQADLLAALELAHTALCEKPKSVTSCDLQIEFAPMTTMVDRAWCSECGNAVLGWNETWRSCPICGSEIQQAAREANPYERRTRESVERILNGVDEHVRTT